MFMSEEIELKEGLLNFVREGQLTNRSVLSFLQHKIGELKKSDHDSVISMFFASEFIFLSFSLEDGRRVPIFSAVCRSSRLEMTRKRRRNQMGFFSVSCACLLHPVARSLPHVSPRTPFTTTGISAGHSGALVMDKGGRRICAELSEVSDMSCLVFD
jgi:hypothetical protein